MSTIRVSLRSVDGFAKTRTFKTLKGARAFAQIYVGLCPSIGTGYAVSDDGVCTIRVTGCTLDALFAAEAATDGYVIEATWDGYEGYYRVRHGSRILAVYDTHAEAEEHVGLCREYDAQVQDSPALRDLECPF